MTDDIKYPFTKAFKVANYIADQLRPHCIRLHIAGSLRRMKPDVKDIEIVCEPRREFIQNGMFADSGDWLIVRELSEALATIQKEIVKGKISGRYMQIISSSTLCPDIKLDLFMPAPEDYFRILAIRTGSADYAHHCIAAAWKRKGWTGVKDLGLRLMKECDSHRDSQNKIHYTLKKDLAAITLPPKWTNEAEFFKWLGLEYEDPEFREFNSPMNIAQ